MCATVFKGLKGFGFLELDRIGWDEIVRKCVLERMEFIDQLSFYHSRTYLIYKRRVLSSLSRGKSRPSGMRTSTYFSFTSRYFQQILK